jgi:hypothetical protein
MNRYAPHVYVIPEDDCDRQLANGFILHDQVKAQRIQVMQPAGGWHEVLKKFEIEYIKRLLEDPLGHVVMLIDFDDAYAVRRQRFEEAIPDGLKDRVFVIGVSHNPEELRRALGKSFEEIGKSLAHDCFGDTTILWHHDQLRHNDPDRQRLMAVVKPFLFPA